MRGETKKKKVSSSILFLKKNHKGLSTVVVALIMVLLSLAAAAVVWGVIRNVIEGSSGRIATESSTIDLEITRAYEQSGNITVIVQRKVGRGNLIKIKFVLSDGEISEIKTEDANLTELESSIFYLSPSKFASSEVESVSVAPVFLFSGAETTGEITDTYYITATGEPGGPGEPEEPEECTPDCTDKECGLDPVCGEPCGICDSSESCINGVCVPFECTPESPEETCGTWVCGTKINNCGEEVDCGSCAGGEFCTGGACVIPTLINEGTVEDVWPGESGMYFGSSDLPTAVSYKNYYINFPGSAEEDCLLIFIYRFPIEGYSKSHIGFNFETSITVNDHYEIWETLQQCQA